MLGFVPELLVESGEAAGGRQPRRALQAEGHGPPVPVAVGSVDVRVHRAVVVSQSVDSAEKAFSYSYFLVHLLLQKVIIRLQSCKRKYFYKLQRKGKNT